MATALRETGRADNTNGSGRAVDERDAHGRTALMIAASSGHEPFVEAALAAGADATLRDEGGLDALAHARARGLDDSFAEVARILGG